MAEVAAKTPKKGQLKEYFRGVKTELKKVVWPTKKETYKYTVIVIAVCAAFAILFWLLDTGVLLFLEQLLKITL